MRVSPEEAEAIAEMRKKRIKEAHSLGGQIRGQQVQEAHAAEPTTDAQREALRLYQDGESPVAISGTLGMSLSTVYSWLGISRQQQGGKTLAKRRKSAESNIKGMEMITEEMASRKGVIFDVDGLEGDMIEGDLRVDNIVEVTSKSVGVISDCHVPFHDLKRTASGEYYGSYITALKYLKEMQIGTLIINGDYIDNYHLSRHEKLERNKKDWEWEADAAVLMLAAIRRYFGDKVRIIYREGNHEERLAKYLAANAPAIQDSFKLHERLKLSSQGIEWVGERSKLTVGKLWVDHGHEWFGSGGVNPARAYRMKAQDNILVGHVHKTSFDMHKQTLSQDFVAGWSMGCLCDLNPLWAPRNFWNHGAVHVELKNAGRFSINNRIIIHDDVL